MMVTRGFAEKQGLKLEIMQIKADQIGLKALLAAVVTTLDSAGPPPGRLTRAVTWVNAGDDALRTFLTDAGWAADTAHRELDLDGTGTTTVKQVRLHTAIG